MLNNDIKSNRHNKDLPFPIKILDHIKKLEFLKKTFFRKLTFSLRAANYLSKHTNTNSKNYF